MTIGIALLLLLAGIGVIAYWKAKLRDVRMLARLRADFQKASEKLANADDDRVPETVIAYLTFFALVLPRRDVLPRLVWHIARGRFERHPPPKDNPIACDLRNLEPPLRDIYAMALSTFLLGLTYNHFILGRIARRFMFWGIDPRQTSHRAVMAAADLARGKRLRSIRGPSGGQPILDDPIFNRAA